VYIEKQSKYLFTINEMTLQHQQRIRKAYLSRWKKD
jgi:hypothetical protein